MGTSKKKSILHIAEEYAGYSSIHGISYIFDKKFHKLTRLLWLVVVLVFLCIAAHLTWNTWVKWGEEQVNMSL